MIKISLREVVVGFSIIDTERGHRTLVDHMVVAVDTMTVLLVVAEVVMELLVTEVTHMSVCLSVCYTWLGSFLSLGCQDLLCNFVNFINTELVKERDCVVTVNVNMSCNNNTTRSGCMQCN